MFAGLHSIVFFSAPYRAFAITCLRNDTNINFAKKKYYVTHTFVRTELNN